MPITNDNGQIQQLLSKPAPLTGLTSCCNVAWTIKTLNHSHSGDGVQDERTELVTYRKPAANDRSALLLGI